MKEEHTHAKMPPHYGRRGHGGPGGPPGMVPGEKAKDFKGSFKRLMSYIGVYKNAMIIVIFMAVASSVFGILTPKVLAGAMDILYDGFIAGTKGAAISIDFSEIRNILFLLGALYLLNAVFRYFQQYIMADIGQKVIFRMRKEVDEKLTRLPIKYFDDNSRGDILSRMSNDIDNIGNSLQQASVQIISSVITIAGVFIMMLSISPFMTLLVLLTLPLIMFVTMVIAKRSQKYFSRQWETLGELNGHVEEMFTGADVVKAYGYEKKAIEKFTEENTRLYEQSRKAQFISGVIMPLINAIGNLSYVLICIAGGLKVINGTLSFSGVTAFIQYQKQFSQPITQTANMMNVFQSAL
ncbi:MAG TPA: ABC transporter ATP-binding protein, partial [Lachnospiraceae bacterium]|nr:ABC transporter ATP-binding protein [Lachnospiraceae bacterium]